MIKKFYWPRVLVIVAILYFLSDIPNLHLIRDSQIPFWLKQLSNKYTFTIGTEGYFSYIVSLHPGFILHKIGHIVVFGTLGLSLYWATKFSVTWAVVLTAIAATLDEWHQSFVLGRSSRFGDVVLDTLATIVFIVIVRAFRKKQ